MGRHPIVGVREILEAVAARRVHVVDRVAAHEGVQVGAVDEAGRIGRNPSAQPRCVVTRPVVVKPRFAVTLLPAVAVALGHVRLPADRLVARAPVGVMLLEGEQVAVAVELDGDGPEGVRQPVADQRGEALVRSPWSASPRGPRLRLPV